jgi:hypothetical protein
MADERSSKHYPLNPFTELLTDNEKLRNVQEDLTSMSGHRTRGIPDGRYLDLADQLLYHDKRERERLK